jgi:small conductance mechanosensitive channel
MTFGVAYKENTDDVRKVINAVLENNPNILKTPATFVEVATLNDRSVDFIVRPFL